MPAIMPTGGGGRHDLPAAKHDYADRRFQIPGRSRRQASHTALAMLRFSYSKVRSSNPDTTPDQDATGV